MPSRVDSWIDGFLDRHCSRHKLDSGDVAVKSWIGAFLALEPSVSESEADSASQSMHGALIEHPEDNLPVLIARIKAIRLEQPPSGANPPSSSLLHEDARAIVEATSRGCLYCHGQGLATIFHPDYAGSPTLEVLGPLNEKRTIPARMVAHCVCDLGRWMRLHSKPDVLARIPDLQRTLDGHTRWTVQDPTVPDGTEVDGATWSERALWVKAVGENVVHIRGDKIPD